MNKEDTVMIIVIIVAVGLLVGGAVVLFGSFGGSGTVSTTTPSGGAGSGQSGEQTPEQTPEQIVQHTLDRLSSSGIPTSECGKIQDVAVREQCYIYNAVRDKTPAACGNISRDMLKRYTCYVSVASIVRDAEICEEVPDNGWRAYCERGVANAAR